MLEGLRGSKRPCMLHTSVRLCHLREFTCRHNQGMISWILESLGSRRLIRLLISSRCTMQVLKPDPRSTRAAPRATHVQCAHTNAHCVHANAHTCTHTHTHNPHTQVRGGNSGGKKCRKEAELMIAVLRLDGVHVMIAVLTTIYRPLLPSPCSPSLGDFLSFSPLRPHVALSFISGIVHVYVCVYVYMYTHTQYIQQIYAFYIYMPI